ncbi:MAG TPA: hypothetical protein VHO50_08130 [Bacteroidales bacterium]|nr:hypothetical protein [Bacteroidales bacterium]
MGKRSAIIIFSILLVAIAIPGYLLLNGRNDVISDPYSAVSPKAGIIIETIDLRSFLNSLTTGKGIIGEIGKIEDFSDFNNKLKTITDNLNKPEYRNLFSESHALISFFHLNDGIKTLLSMPVPENISYRQISHALVSSGVKTPEVTEFIDEEILRFKYSDNDTAYISIKSGLLLATNSLIIIKEAYKSVDSKNDVRNLKGFSRILLSSGDEADKIFLIFDNLPAFLRTLISQTRGEILRQISSVATASSADIFVNDDGIVFNGYSESTDSTDYLYKLKDATPGTFHTVRILPSATAMFEAIMYKASDYKETQSDSKIMKLAGGLKKYIGDEITSALIDIDTAGNNKTIIYELTNREMAEQFFLDQTADDRSVMWFQPDDQFKIPVYKLPYHGLIDALMPGFAPSANDSLFVFYENFLISGSSYLTIAGAVYDNLLNNTLANDVVYRNFEGSLPTLSSYFFYVVPSRIVNYLDGFLNETLVRSLKKNRNIMSRIPAAGLRLASSNGMIYNSIALSYKENISEESSTEWETLLDSMAATKPFFFTNHLTGATEIFVQDAGNNAYLINSAGRILWKAPLSEKIEGSIYMIDYYKNGKYQLLFNGKNYLHLLDRNGNYVERYPVKLRSAATNSLALFDYEDNRNYRLIIAGEDRLIYSYDKFGSIVKGWKPFKTEGIVRAQANYFKVSGKDFIVVSDNKSFYLLDRYGNKRITFREQVSRASGSTLKITEGSETFLTCTTEDGTIQHVYFDGNVKKNSFRKFTADHLFDFSDFDGDGNNEFLFIDEGSIYLFNGSGEQIISKNIGSDKLQGPLTFTFSSSDKRIGLFDSGKNLIFLLDANGDLSPGFPLKGASLFSIGKLAGKNDWQLVVGGPDEFLYNYRIDTDK